MTFKCSLFTNLCFHYRFVNILQKAQNAKINMWNMVKKLRPYNQFMSDNFEATYSCMNYDTILKADKIKLNNERLEKELGLKGDSIPMGNITKDTLKTAFEMFTYMNLCSGSGTGSMYRNIFKNSSPKNIILALKSILLKSSKSDKQNAEKIWSFVTTKLDLTNHRKYGNFTFENFSSTGYNFNTSQLLLKGF